MPEPAQRRRHTPKTNANIAVAYVRCSTRDKQQASPEVQRAAIEEWAAKHDVRIVQWHEERVSGSARVEDRAQLIAAIDALREHKAGRLLVAKRDRLARDSDAAGYISHEVRRRGAIVVAVDGAELEGATGKLVRDVLDAVAEFEGGLIRGRIKQALAAKKLKGECCGQVPFGFERRGMLLVEVPSEQAAIRAAVEMRAKGLGYLHIGHALAKAGHRPRGAAWYSTTVKNILVQHEARRASGAARAPDDAPARPATPATQRPKRLAAAKGTA